MKIHSFLFLLLSPISVLGHGGPKGVFSAQMRRGSENPDVFTYHDYDLDLKNALTGRDFPGWHISKGPKSISFANDGTVGSRPKNVWYSYVRKASKKSHYVSPTSAPSDSPSIRPTRSSAPSDVPSAILSAMPSVVPTDMPSGIPSDVPSDMPSDVPSDISSTMPSSLPSFIPSEAPSNAKFLSACRCDDEGNCLSQPIQPGIDLNLCIFAQPNLEILSIESLRIIQEDFVLDLQTTGNQSGILRQCTGKLCIVSTPLPTSLFGAGRPNFMSVEGIALAQIEAVNLRKLRGLQLVEDDTETVDMSFDAEIALGLDRFPLQVDENQPRDEGNGDGTKIVAWLLPLILLLLLCCLCICFAYRRRRNEKLTEADVYDV